MATARQLFAVDGLWCGNCARGLEQRLRAQPGIEQVAVHFLTASALIQWNPQHTSRDAIADTIASVGYTLVERPQPDAILARLDQTIRALAMRLAVAVVFGMWSMAAGIALYTGTVRGDQAWWLAVASAVTAAPVLLWAGRDILRMAVRSLRLRTPGIDLLVSLGITGACVLSLWHLAQGSSDVYFDTATMLVTLLLAGRLVEAQLRRRAMHAIVAMQAAENETALRLDHNDTPHAVPVAHVSIGDRVLVRAGAVAAIDGVVASGRSRVDNAVLSGETSPQHVETGERICAGSLNLDSALVVVSDRDIGDRDLDRMGGRIALELVARQPTADTQTRISEVLGRWIPAFALAVGVAVLLAGLGVETAVLRTLAVLVAACPCALAVATPLAHLQVAIQASRRGLRIADPGSLPALANARTAIFDKTGTLTIGAPRLQAVHPQDGWSAAQVLAAGACAEAGIDHPLAHAIVAAAASTVPCADTQRQAHSPGLRDGRGATGVWQARSVRVSAAPAALVSALASTSTTFAADSTGRLTWLQVSIDTQVAGLLAIADGLDSHAAAVLAALRADGVRVQLASGDAAAAVQSIASACGIETEHAHAALSPADKADLVRRAEHPVLFVGDGVNDAPAMAAADCGVSVARAHPATQATAAVGILHGGLTGILDGRALAGWGQRLVQRNLWAALAYNAAILPLALFGQLPPLGAALAMTASSLTQIALVLGSRPPRSAGTAVGDGSADTLHSLAS